MIMALWPWACAWKIDLHELMLEYRKIFNKATSDYVFVEEFSQWLFNIECFKTFDYEEWGDEDMRGVELS